MNTVILEKIIHQISQALYTILFGKICFMGIIKIIHSFVKRVFFKVVQYLLITLGHILKISMIFLIKKTGVIIKGTKTISSF